MTTRRSDGSFTAHSRRQISVLAAVLRRDLDRQIGRSGTDFVLGLLEPLLHIGVLCAWHYLVRVVPTYGTSIVLFISTGVYPVFVFIHLSTSIRFYVRDGYAGRRFHAEQVLDLVISGSLLTFISYLLVGLVLFTGIAVWVTEQAIPRDVVCIAQSLTALACMGIGFGICSAVINQVFPLWHYFWGTFVRVLIFFSGVLYVADFLPLHLRDILVWNPILHAVTLFRSGFYSNYPMLTYDPLYMWVCSLSSVVMGLCLLRVLRRKLAAI